MDTKRKVFALFFIVIFLFFPATPLLAIDFPTKPINVIVGFGPGGTSDLSTRAMVDKMAKILGVPIIVLNKPGSGGITAAQFVASSKPDGYNVFVGSVAHIGRQSFDPQMPVDMLKDFEPISNFCGMVSCLVVKADSKFKTFDDLVDYALKNPGKLSQGTPGVGSGGHFAAELLKATFGISFKHVPFTSDSQVVTALMGGHIDFMVGGWGQVSSKTASGDLRVILTFGETRFPELKDIPILKEKGFPEATITVYFYFVAPAGTPKEIIEKIDEAARKATEDPVVVATLKNMGFYGDYKGPAELGKFLKSELEKYVKLSKKAGITIK